MNILRSAIDGPYALLLVLQILVVAGLLLALIWMLIYRQREEIKPAENEMAKEPPKAIVSSLTASHEVQQEIAPIAMTGEAMDLTAATLGGENESEPVVKEAIPAHEGGGEMSREMKQKIGFLESKLLEYEIVQEEIANLSLLKLENEKLREEIVRLKKTVTTLPSSKEEMTDPTADVQLDKILNQLENLTGNVPK